MDSKEEKRAAKQALKEAKKAEKAAKKSEKLAQKAMKKNEQDLSGGEKKKGGKKFILIAAVVLLLAAGAAAFFFLRKDAGPKDPEEVVPEPIEAPVVYTLSEISLPALPVLGDALVYLEEKPEDAPETEATYRYEGFHNPHAMTSAYVNFLTVPDIGFSQVDDQLVRLDDEELSDLEAESGSVHLARNLPEGMVWDLQLSWTPENCLLKMDAIEGRVTSPKPETPVYSEPISLTEALDRVKSLDPAKLGLPGTSMEDYEVYSEVGSVLIGGTPCIRLNVYHNDQESGTNENMGNLFLSSDGQHLYRLNVETGTVQEIPGALND